MGRAIVGVIVAILTLSCGISHQSEDADAVPTPPADCSLWDRPGCPFANADVALSSGWLQWVVVDWGEEDRSPISSALRIDGDGTFHIAFSDQLNAVFYATGTPATGFVHERVAGGGVDEVEPSLTLCDGVPRLAFSLATGQTVLATRADSGWDLEDLPFHGDGGPAQPAITCDGGELWVVGKESISSDRLAVVRPDGSRGTLPDRFSFDWLPATALEMQPSTAGIGVLMNHIEGAVVAVAPAGREWEWAEHGARGATLLRGGPFASYEIVEVAEEPTAHAVRVRDTVSAEGETLPLPSRLLQDLDAVLSAERVTHLGLDAVYELHHAWARGDEWSSETVDEPGPGAHPSLDLEGERPWVAYRDRRRRLVVATHPRDW
jgi:hypothetical protein